MAIDTSGLPFPKPGHKKQPRTSVGIKQIKPDGRHILKAKEYRHRRTVIHKLYGRTCIYCLQPLSKGDCTTDHRNPRGIGGGQRDERWPNLLPMHGRCNVEKASRRIPGLIGRQIMLLNRSLSIDGYLTDDERKLAGEIINDLKNESET